MITDSTELREELHAASVGFENASPSDIIRWAVDRFSPAAFACSFEDLVLLDLINRESSLVDVIFLDTKGHFPETHDFVATARARWGLSLVTTTPGPDAAEFPCGTAECCQRRKVDPLGRTLANYQVWFTSVKRADGPTRRDMPIVSWDEKFHLVKVNPLATWSDDDVAYYLRSQGLPEHPLWERGYASIGCAAVTEPPAPGADRRSGRWAGSEKEECGLHEG